MQSNIERIEARRLELLEEQAARFGPQTDPVVLIEIAELKHKQNTGPNAIRRQFVNSLDYDFLMNVVAAALVRVGAVEANQQADDSARSLRQLVHDIWMVAITIMVFLSLIKRRNTV